MSDLWVVNAFFNPVGYRSRRENHRIFRERLGAPLLTVELVYGDTPALAPGDADLLVRVGSGDVLWQKERLLNIALGHLPPDCRYVAWIDSDMVFGRVDWADRAKEALREQVLIQPFSEVRHLRRGADLSGFPVSDVCHTRESFAWQHQRGVLSFACVARREPLTFSPGYAWAMRREQLERVGFYDAAITGGGTVLTAAAALGEFEAAVGRCRMGRRQAAHYLGWAKRFHEAVGGKIGVVEGPCYHLWHGEMAHRGYESRFTAMEPFDFDPERDIALGPEGAWRWNTDKPALHAYLREYFVDRREDGATG